MTFDVVPTQSLADPSESTTNSTEVQEALRPQLFLAIRSLIEEYLLDIFAKDPAASGWFLINMDVAKGLSRINLRQLVELCHLAQQAADVPFAERFYLYNARDRRLSTDALDLLGQIRFRILTGRAQRELKRERKIRANSNQPGSGGTEETK